MLSASLSLDIKRFEAGLDKAAVELQVFERATKNTNRDLKRLMEDFSGQKIATEAARAAEAVKRIGGASMLTEAEQKRVNATVTAAIEKYQALGQTAPAQLLSLQQATARASTSTSSLLGAVGQMAAAFSVAGLITKGATALVSFGVAALDNAGKLVDLNKATNVSIATLQRWAHIADQGGIELDNLTTASFKLGAAIDGGGSGVRGAVERLGLAWDKLRSQKPEDQMNEILAAAEALGPSQERNAILVELFGNRGAQALARVVEGWKETGLAASVAADEQVKALDRASDRWSKFLKDLGTGFTATMGRVVLEMENLNDAAGGANRQGFIGGGEFDPRLAAADEVRQAAERSAAARKTDIELTQESIGATKSYVAELAKLTAQIDEVVKVRGEELAAAVKVNTSTEEITRTFGLSEEAQRLYASSTKDTNTELKSADSFTAAWNNSLAENAKKSAEAAVEAKRFIDALNTKVQFGGDTLKDMTGLLERRFTGPMVAALLSNFKAHQQYQRDLDVLTEGRTMTRVNAEIAQIQRWAKEQKAGLDIAAGAWRENAEAIDALAKSRIDKIIDDDLVDQMVLFANETTKATARLEKLPPLFDRIKNAAMDAATSLRHLAEVSGNQGLAKVATVAHVVGTALKDLGEMNKALANKDGIGALIAGIKLATNLAVSMWDALTKSPGEKAAKEIGRIFGVTVTEAIGDAIAKTAKTLFGGDRFAASIFNLQDIIDAAGGLNSENLETMTARLRDVFVMLQRGTFSAAQAVKVLDANWRAFVEAGTDAHGRLAPGLVEIIRLTRELGVASKEVLAYTREQSSVALTAFNAVAAGTVRWQQYGDAVKKAQKTVDDLNKTDARGRGAEWTKEMAEAQALLTAALTEQQHAGKGATGSLADLAVQAMAAFNAALASGMSYSEALKLIQPGIQAIIKAHQDLGLSIDDPAMKALAMQSALLEKNPEILAGLDGIAQGMVALGNLGLMNADTFAAMQRTAMEMYARIQAEIEKAGMTGDDAARAALLPMQKYLQEAAAQAELLGVPLDENTQRLIDQSKAAGIWKEKTVDPMTQVRDVAIEIRDAIREMVDAMKKIPSRVDTRINTRYTTEGEPPPSDPTDRSGSGGGGSRGSGIQDSNGNYPIEPRAAQAAVTPRAPAPTPTAPAPTPTANTEPTITVVVVNGRDMPTEEVIDATLQRLVRAIPGNQHNLRVVLREVLA